LVNGKILKILKMYGVRVNGNW